MPMYNKHQIATWANDLGFIRDTFEKVVRLAEILKFIESDPLLSSGLALKGGTAINLILLNLPRLSVDIDLDYTHDNNLNDMMADRETITHIIEQYMAAEGYILSVKSKSAHTLDSFVYAYINSAGINDNIKIEINYSLRCHVLPLIVVAITSTSFFGTTKALSVAPMEIFASKIVALLTRTAARDLYDIYNIAESGIFDESEEIMLRKSVVFYAAITSGGWSRGFDINRVDGLTTYKVRTDLQPLLRKQDWFDLSVAQKCVKEYLVRLLVLEENERHFLDAFQKKEYRPELLFTGDALERIKNHPMAVWKSR